MAIAGDVADLLLKSAPLGNNSGVLIDVTVESAGWEFCGLTVVKLAPGETWSRPGNEDEIALVPLGGRCTVTSGGQEWTIGERSNPFTGQPWAVYLPLGRACEVRAESPLELAGNELIACADEGQNFDDLPVPRHRPVGRERDSHRHRRNDQRQEQQGHADENIRHVGKSFRPDAVVIERRVGRYFGDRGPQSGEINGFGAVELQDDHPGDREFVEVDPLAKPRLEQQLRFLFGHRPNLGHAGGRARRLDNPCDIRVDIAIGRWLDLDRRFSRYGRTPFAAGLSHEDGPARRERGEECHDRHDDDQGSASDAGGGHERRF